MSTSAYLHILRRDIVREPLEMGDVVVCIGVRVVAEAVEHL